MDAKCEVIKRFNNVNWKGRASVAATTRCCMCVNLLALNCSSWLKLCKNLNLHLLATKWFENWRLFFWLNCLFDIFLRIVQANQIRNAFIVEIFTVKQIFTATSKKKVSRSWMKWRKKLWTVRCQRIMNYLNFQLIFDLILCMKTIF